MFHNKIKKIGPCFLFKNMADIGGVHIDVTGQIRQGDGLIHMVFHIGINAPDDRRFDRRTVVRQCSANLPKGLQKVFFQFFDGFKLHHPGYTQGIRKAVLENMSIIMPGQIAAVIDQIAADGVHGIHTELFVQHSLKKLLQLLLQMKFFLAPEQALGELVDHLVIAVAGIGQKAWCFARLLLGKNGVLQTFTGRAEGAGKFPLRLADFSDSPKKRTVHHQLIML